MANETKTAEATNVVVSFTADSPVIKSLAYVIDLAQRKGFNPLKGDHSVQYWTEEFIAKACKDYKGAIERDVTRRNNEAYLAAEKLVSVPLPTAKPEEWMAYGRALQSLRTKYGIGGSPKEV